MRGRVPCAFTCILQSDLTAPLAFIHGIFLNISGMSASSEKQQLARPLSSRTLGLMKETGVNKVMTLLSV